MEWHFGHNCKHYLPSLNKCRVLIDNYRRRPDLVEMKQLGARDLLTYLGLPNEEVMEQVYRGEIEVKPQKTGKALYQVASAWRWDACPLVEDGGQCFYYEPHDGNKLSCLMELRDSGYEHPNLKNLPSEEEIAIFEGKAIEISRRPKTQ